MKKLKILKLSGLSSLEIILAAALFAIFSIGITTLTLQGLDANRLGSEETIASQFASEGIEAVKSIKNQTYAGVVNYAGTGVVRNGSNVWSFSGSNNIFGQNNKFTRVITVGDVNRDVSGNIVSSGGSLDPDTKKVTATVSWNINARSDSVLLTTYLSDWRKAIVDTGNGVLMYSDSVTSPTSPKYRFYNNTSDTYGAQNNAVAGSATGLTFKVKTSPIKKEAIAGYVNASGVLQIMCFDGTTWTNEWTQTVGGTGTTQRFGIAYEKTTGDAVVVYSTNASASNEMGYRIKLGSTGCGSTNWSSNTNISTVRTSGVVQWIRMEASPVSGSNTIALAWSDSNNDLSAMEWTGSSWAVAEPASALETNLECISATSCAGQDVQSFDIAFESVTGNLMIVWSPFVASSCTAGSNCIKYSRYTGSWLAATAIPTIADEGTSIDISANPNTNEIVLAAIGNSSADLSTAYWSGTTWTGRANVDTTATAPVAGTKLVTTGWLISGATTRYIVAYMDANGTAVSWYVGTGSAAPSKQTDFTPTPAIGNPKKWMDIQMDPLNTDRLMFLTSDVNNDLFAKRLVMTSTPAFTWTNSDGGAAIEANLGQAITAPYSFAYWRQ